MYLCILYCIWWLDLFIGCLYVCLFGYCLNLKFSGWRVDVLWGRNGLLLGCGCSEVGRFEIGIGIGSDNDYDGGIGRLEWLEVGS